MKIVLLIGFIVFVVVVNIVFANPHFTQYKDLLTFSCIIINLSAAMILCGVV